MSKRLIKKSNQLANAAYTFTLAEQRLVLLAIAEAGGDKETLKTVSIHARQYAEQFKVTLSAAYKALRDASLQLFERRFSYQVDGKRGSITKLRRWVQGVDYGDSDGVLRLIFSDDVLPALCELQERFMQYGLEQIANLTSIHAMRLYEILITWRSTGKTPVYELSDFRQRLGIEPEEYPRMTDFKRWVLDAAIKQINKHTDITASYEQHKRGRTITGFSFTFSMKRPERLNQMDTELSKPKRRIISKAKAEAMARPGESYSELYQRLSSEYSIKD